MAEEYGDSVCSAVQPVPQFPQVHHTDALPVVTRVGNMIVHTPNSLLT